MKRTYARRYRRHSSSSREARMFKKNSQQEHTFFGGSSYESFFKPNLAIQRKCDHCEAEEKSVKRMGDTKEEEKKVQKMDTKEEEKKVRKADEKKEEDKPVQKMEAKEEEKKVQKADEKKEEDKAVQKMDAKEEEKKVQKADEKKEEDKAVQKMDAKEEEKKVQKADEKKEEDKAVQKMDANEEEKKVQKADEKKEEDKAVQKMDAKEEEKKLDKKDAGAPGSGISATGAYIKTLPGKGQSLPGDARQFFQKRMGHDFSHVKIHTGTDAEKSAKDMNAKAYAVDNHIVFNKGQYNPGSPEGKKLLAHELTHIVQQKGNNSELLNRVTENAESRNQTVVKQVSSGGKATNSRKQVAYGCEDVNVQAQTDANYTDSFTSTGSATPSTKCDDCQDDCVSATGTIVSVFKANPVVTLPAVPGGLSECETNAVTKFINTTLKNHEQRHVAAFNTYNATIKTPYKFVGCQGALDAYLQSLHDSLNAKRTAAANAKSSALDPFNPPIPCNCE